MKEKILSLIGPFFSLASPGAVRGRLSILIYHQVLEHPDPLRPEVPDVSVFEWQMQLLKQHLCILLLDDAVRRLRSGTLPRRAVCITFDDGYADSTKVVLPILQRFGVSATFFIATAFLNGGRMWHDTVIETLRHFSGDWLDLSDSLGQRFLTGTIFEKRRSVRRLIMLLKGLSPTIRDAEIRRFAAPVADRLPNDLMMTSEQVRVLHQAGMVVGGHTATHPIFTTVDLDTVYAEILQGRLMLEDLLDAPVTLFAYPNGRPFYDYMDEHVNMVRELGFEAAVSTTSGVATRTDDYWQLPRFTPWDRVPERFLARLLLNYTKTHPDVIRNTL